MQNKIAITVGRTFGSGGRAIAKMIADELGIRFFDKRLLSDAARVAGISENIFANADERAPSFLAGLMSFNMGVGPATWISRDNSISDENIYMAQSKFIEQIASEDSCVIVGRTADHILRRHPHALHIFIHASNPDHVAARIMERGDARNSRDALAIARKINHIRADYYNFYTDKKWGDAASYDLSFDSSRIAPEQIVATVRNLIEK